MQLFSRMVIGDRAMPTLSRPVQIAYDRMHAVIATPKPQPGLEPDVEVGERQHAAQQRAHQHRAPGQLLHAVAAARVDLLVPLPLDLLGRALEPVDGQRVELQGVGGCCQRVGRWSWAVPRVGHAAGADLMNVGANAAERNPVRLGHTAAG